MKAFLIYTTSVILSIAFCVGVYFLALWITTWPLYWQISVLALATWVAIIINTAKAKRRQTRDGDKSHN